MHASVCLLVSVFRVQFRVVGGSSRNGEEKGFIDLYLGNVGFEGLEKLEGFQLRCFVAIADGARVNTVLNENLSLFHQLTD